jgi:Protein of unknown function (DUF3305)
MSSGGRWRCSAVCAAPWTPLTIDGKTATFYAGAAEIELYRSEADNYRRNLASATPAIVAEHHVEQVFTKRTRDRADPEALARHGPRFRDDNER